MKPPTSGYGTLFPPVTDNSQQQHLPARMRGKAPSYGSYTFRQRGVLYFRVRVPQPLQHCLGRTEYRRSLGFVGKREAQAKALRLFLVSQDIFNCTKEYLSVTMQTAVQGPGKGKGAYSPNCGGNQLASLTTEKIREIAHKALNECLETAYESRLFSSQSIGSGADDDTKSELLCDMLESIDSGGLPPKNIRQWADELLEEEGIAPKPVSPEEEKERCGNIAYRKICDKLERAGAACLESELSGPCWGGSLAVAKDWNVSMAALFIKEREEMAARGLALQSSSPARSFPLAVSRVAASPLPPVGQALGQPNIPTLREAVAKKIEIQKQNWGSKATAMDVPKRLETFLAILEEGKDSVTTFAEFAQNRDAMRKYYDIITRIPAQYSKKQEYAGLNFSELAALNVPPEQRLKSETLKNQFNTVKGFLSWAGEEGYLMNPSHYKKLLIVPKVAKTCKRRGCTTDELRRLFAPECFLPELAGRNKQEKPWRFWVPLLALFTGARLEEICQLNLEDIGYDDAVKCWFIHITDQTGSGGKSVKTEAARRVVPLHHFFTEDKSPAPFIQYVESLRKRGETRLFPMLKANSRGNVSDAVSKWFTAYRRKCGIGAEKNGLSDVSFHSFRHTVITSAKVKDIEQRKVKQMVGHEDDASGNITQRYEGNYPLEIIFHHVVERLDFDTALDLYTVLQGVSWE